MIQDIGNSQTDKGMKQMQISMFKKNLANDGDGKFAA
jgi:hypothetical protein